MLCDLNRITVSTAQANKTKNMIQYEFQTAEIAPGKIL